MIGPFALKGSIMTKPVLLDTRAAIWLMEGAPLADAALDAIHAAQRAYTGVFVSPISAWEIGSLVEKRRIDLARPPEVWFDALLALPGVRLAPMTPTILIASRMLPGVPPRDPFNSVIAATARAFGYIVVTRGQQLISYGEAGHLEIVPC